MSAQDIEYLVYAIEKVRDLHVAEREQEFMKVEQLLLRAIEELANQIIAGS